MPRRDLDEQAVPIHHAEAFAAMRAAGRLAARTLDMIAGEIAPGRTTRQLDRLCEAFIRDHGAVPAPLGYQGYPYATCMSPNEVVCHGMPDDQALEDGDLLKIDITTLLDGWHGDSCRTFPVGRIGQEQQALVRLAEDALRAGIGTVRPGSRLSAIGQAIQSLVETHGCSVVHSHCGHGIGQAFHQPPKVRHHLDLAHDLELRPGMFFTIEPMVNRGGFETVKLADGWTIVTRDGSLSTQFEHTVGVTETGVEIFTRLDGP
ncbi:MAG TPA: type I methionyl aminopeptidase [Geminicoccus sp.]|jgi:methionyl aminopeptidase|uniref:type I methionyl aminopeptidase n=1 Tax=Geminicoccus sp. TaxID=2024832 RepID=UPI002E32EDF7|nr:type I methionyl aminopeptidase [Geminicoccus sp.]HEX2525631.1 type I methionyl aminopeptidase [Geminicoccus sp.]